MKINSWFGLIMLLAFAMVSTAAAADRAGTVVGIVVDAENKGVEAVDVSIYAAADTKKAIATTESAADGKFTLKDVPAGKGYVVNAIKRKSALGVRAEHKDVAVEDGKATDVGNLELKVPTDN